MLHYLLRDLAADLRNPATLSPEADACHLVARDELRIALGAIQSIRNCLDEVAADF